jgi:arginase family enzyme
MPVILGGGHDMAFGHFLGVARARDRAPACVQLRRASRSPTDSSRRSELRHALHAGARVVPCPRVPFRYAALGTQRASNAVSLFQHAHDAGALIVDADGFALDTIEEVMEALNDEVGDEELCPRSTLMCSAPPSRPGSARRRLWALRPTRVSAGCIAGFSRASG